jgi:hypothetical protein
VIDHFGEERVKKKSSRRKKKRKGGDDERPELDKVHVPAQVLREAVELVQEVLWHRREPPRWCHDVEKR